MSKIESLINETIKNLSEIKLHELNQNIFFEQRMLNQKAASKYMGVCLNKFKELNAPSCLYGGVVRYDICELDQFIKNSKVDIMS